MSHGFIMRNSENSYIGDVPLGLRYRQKCISYNMDCSQLIKHMQTKAKTHEFLTFEVVAFCQPSVIRMMAPR